MPKGTGDPPPQVRGWLARAQAEGERSLEGTDTVPSGSAAVCVFKKNLGWLGGALAGVGFPALQSGAESAEVEGGSPSKARPPAAGEVEGLPAVRGVAEPNKELAVGLGAPDLGPVNSPGLTLRTRVGRLGGYHRGRQSISRAY